MLTLRSCPEIRLFFSQWDSQARLDCQHPTGHSQQIVSRAITTTRSSMANQHGFEHMESTSRGRSSHLEPRYSSSPPQLEAILTAINLIHRGFQVSSRATRSTLVTDGPGNIMCGLSTSSPTWTLSSLIILYSLYTTDVNAHRPRHVCSSPKKKRCEILGEDFETWSCLCYAVFMWA